MLSIARSLGACAYRRVPTPPDPGLLELIAQRLKQARREKKKTQEDVARDLDIATMTLSRYERGRHVPESAIATRLADYYGVSVDWLLGRDQVGPETPITRLVRDDAVLQIVEQFIAELDADDLAEFERLDGREWAEGLAFAADAMRRLGTEPSTSLVRRLWSERKAQLQGKIPTPARTTTVPEGKRKLPKGRKVR